jgi:hypothetical protein
MKRKNLEIAFIVLYFNETLFFFNCIILFKNKDFENKEFLYIVLL